MIIVLILTGCAQQKQERNSSDPFEGYNRFFHRFNMTLNDHLLSPIASVYEKVGPVFLRERITDLLYTVNTPFYSVCYLFSGNIKGSVLSLASFFMNAIFGFLGVHNVAKILNLDQNPTNFDATLKSWGCKSGAYIVLPILGPSSPRSILGMIIGFCLNPFYYLLSNNNRNYIYAGMYAVEMINYKMSITDLEKQMRKDSSDFYVTLRSAYFQISNNNLKEDFYIDEGDL